MDKRAKGTIPGVAVGAQGAAVEPARLIGHPRVSAAALAQECWAMHVRISRCQCAPDRVDECSAEVGRGAPTVRGVPGSLGVAALFNRASGAGLLVSYWESEEAMRASETAAAGMRSAIADAGGGRITSVEHYEVALLERAAPARAGTFARVNAVAGSPGRLDDAVEMVRSQALPILKAQPGFRFLGTYVDRDSGRSLVVSIWTTAEDREASEARIQGTRRQVGESVRADVEVELYEVTFSDIRAAAAAGTE
jgi:heme-degrading monooxygenase HmoA